MEFAYSHDLELPAAEAALFHIVPQSQLDREVAAGAFNTVSTCDRDTVEDQHLAQLYRGHVEIEFCHVFWDRIAPAQRRPNLTEKAPK
jgi:hypothetical protein